MVVIAVLSVAWLVGGPGELRGQDPRVITVQENAEHFLVTALREIVMERDSIAIEQLERAPIPSAGTLIAQGEGDVLLEMFWDEPSERRFRDVEPKPELEPLAELLRSTLRSWGIPTRTADTPVPADLCEYVTVVEPSRRGHCMGGGEHQGTQRPTRPPGRHAHRTHHRPVRARIRGATGLGGAAIQRQASCLPWCPMRIPSGGGAVTGRRGWFSES